MPITTPTTSPALGVVTDEKGSVLPKGSDPPPKGSITNDVIMSDKTGFTNRYYQLHWLKETQRTV